MGTSAKISPFGRNDSLYGRFTCRIQDEGSLVKIKKFIYCLAENVILNVAVFSAFFWYSPAREDFLTMNLHPLLIITALMALKYGNYLGIMSAFIAAITFTSAYYLLGKDLILLIMDFSYYKFLLMFFLSAVIFGVFRDKKEYTINNLTTELESVRNSYEDLLETEKKSRFVNEELRKQIVGAEDSILSLYEVASALETVNSEEVYTETMALLARFLKAKTVSIYTVDKHQKYLRLKIRLGGLKGMGNSIEVANYDHFKKVVHGREIVRMNPESEEKVPLLSAPLVKNQEVIAVINVEEIDFEMVTEYSYNLFKIIVEWTNKALVQAIEVEAVVDRAHYYENTKIMKMEKFGKRLDEEKRRVNKFGLEYGLISVKKGRHDLIEFDTRLSGLIRQVDVVGYDQEADVIHILLPITPREAVTGIEERVFGGFDYQLERAR